MLMKKKKRIMGTKAKKTIPSNGNNFRSKFELDFSQHLLRLQRDGVLAGWKHEDETLKYVIEHKYLTDFKLVGNHGRVMYIETKGYFTGKDRTKHKKVRERHPDKDVRFIFMNSATKLNPSSKTTYGSWCTKNGFKYADRVMPAEWIRELNKE